MAKRRDVLKAGAAAALTTPAIFGGVMLPEVARAQLCRAEGLRTQQTEHDSPPVRPYIEPLFIPPTLHRVNPAALSPPPDPNRHQRFEDFPPVKFYETHLKQVYWNYHQDLSSLNPNNGSIGWGYDGVLPGPTLVARYGEAVFVRRHNDLPQAADTPLPFGYPAITTHLHNAHTATESDGYPMDFVEPGNFWDHHYAMIYARNNPDEALASLWYHDHMINFTATNVYSGLSAMAIFYDDLDSGDERDKRHGALRLPSGYGKYDIPMILHDVRFTTQGHPDYNLFNTDGHLGDYMTINRKVMPFLKVERRKYRFRIYDGGPSRFYELMLGDNSTMFVIANDGNLLEEPVEVSSIVMGPANRYDVVIDFSRYRPGQSVELLNVMEHINGMGPSGRRLDPGLRVMRFDVIDSNVEDNSQLPDFMRRLPRIDLDSVVAHREWIFDHDMGLWTINGSFMDPTVISAAPKQGTAEIWTIRNAGSGWAHPAHIHFEEGRVLEWNGRKPVGVLNSRKDVYMLGPNDEIKVFYRFDDFLGRYVIHCHNNVHEDNAMMLRWDIVPS
ncbi:MAG: hypothetical protein B7Z66_09550 [Chromatiales bacterium 21-64-14]|nr:MAG: hypothetical protein B7Z66_09550 [Chromatiales bacterium 21-64-14]HQU16331.1 multicopper oxidase domain-containing protein [Gammaproteobacteria bacterium]